MSVLRRRKQRGPLARAAIAAAMLFTPVGRLARGVALARAGRGMLRARRRRRAGRRSRLLTILAGAGAIATAAGVLRRRRQNKLDLPPAGGGLDVGPPNESAPGHAIPSPADADVDSPAAAASDAPNESAPGHDIAEPADAETAAAKRGAGTQAMAGAESADPQDSGDSADDREPAERAG